MTASGGMQTAVSGIPAPGVAGDFSSSNPRQRVLSGPGGLVSGGGAYGADVPIGASAAGSAVVGRFGWLSPQVLDPDNAPTIVNSFYSPGGGMQTAITGLNGLGAPDGFISRPDSSAIITIYLSDATMLIQEGCPVPLWASGDFWCINNGAGQAYVGQKAYANLSNGQVSFGASGAPSTATATSWSIAPETWSSTASISGNIMTVTAGSNIYPGVVLTAGGVGAVLAQLTGTPQGIGTYLLSEGEQSVASTTVSGTYGLLTLTTVSAGTFGIGTALSGTSVATGAFITQFITGSGGSGSTAVTLTATASSGTLTGNTTVETVWEARSSGAAGELVKITSVRQ
jgi:hypothetical protein